MAVIDPGPDDPGHLDAVARLVGGADRVHVLVTHDHPDHAAGAASLAGRLAAPLLGPVEGGRPLAEGEAVPTDHGELVALPTPGHARAHLAFHWPRAGAVFVGDLLLGRGDTTWVGEYPGCVADYLRSLERLEVLGPRVLYPTHGPPLADPLDALRRYRAHREERIREVAAVLDEHPSADADEVARRVYGGEVPPGLVEAARRSAEVLLHHLRERS